MVSSILPKNVWKQFDLRYHSSKIEFLGVALILCYVMLCCLILCSKSDALNKWNLMALLCCVMICYADLFYEQNQWVKSCDPLCSQFWEVMIEIFVSKTLCTVMNSYFMSKIFINVLSGLKWQASPPLEFIKIQPSKR